MIEANYIFEFLVRSIKQWRPVDEFCHWPWFWWRWENAEVQAYIDQGKIKGVIVGRRVSCLKDAMTDNFVNLNGDVLFVEQACVEEISLFDLVNESLPHFMWVNSIIFCRNGDEKYRHWKLSKLVRKLSSMKESYGTRAGR